MQKHQTTRQKMKITVSEFAIRQLIKEKLTPVDPNPVVDPSAAVTNPQNKNFNPGSVAEFQVGLNSHLEDLPVEKLRSSYEEIVGVLTKKKSSKGDKKMRSRKMTVAEAIIRKHIRKIISEAEVPRHRTKDNLARAQSMLRVHGVGGDRGSSSADSNAIKDGLSKLMISADDATSVGGRGDMGVVNDMLSGKQLDEIEIYHGYGKKAVVRDASPEQAMRALGAVYSAGNGIISKEDYLFLDYCLQNIRYTKFDPKQKEELIKDLKETVWTYCDTFIDINYSSTSDSKPRGSSARRRVGRKKD